MRYHKNINIIKKYKLNNKGDIRVDHLLFTSCIQAS